MAYDPVHQGLKGEQAAKVQKPEHIPSVPDHALLRCIGRGSYGEVWLARGVLGTLRAVKVVYRNRFHNARPYEREFTGILRIEPLSRAHEGLVDILHVGRHEPEGYFYYVMELADDANADEPLLEGSTLNTDRYEPRTLARELKRRGRLSFEECVQLGLNLSSSLSHLHQNGLLHRDVKPSNILYVGGLPKLGDIGLVGEASESASYVGTEGYIPPEGPNTAQTDVYSLGKILYEASTGQDRNEFPLLPTDVMDAPSRAQLAELNEVFLKACAPDPRQRYQTAEELHADLALLHRGQSVRRQRRAERRWRFASLAAYVGLFLAGLALGVLWSPLQRSSTSAGTPGDHAKSSVPKQAPVDMTRYYNSPLGSNWLHDFSGNDLASLPTSWRRFGQAYFSPGGVIQLTGTYTQKRRLEFPTSVEGIAIGRRCARLHFLHGTVWIAEKSKHVAAYLIHYADGRQEEIPVRYGEEVKNWWWDKSESLNVAAGSLAWVGTNAFAGGADKHAKVRLYTITWNNPYPDVSIKTLDFISTCSTSCPFLVAVTAE